MECPLRNHPDGWMDPYASCVLRNRPLPVVNYEINIPLALGVTHALSDANERWKRIPLGRSVVEKPDSTEYYVGMINKISSFINTLNVTFELNLLSVISNVNDYSLRMFIIIYLTMQ